MNNKIAILGCAKNCSKYISDTINNMHKICNMFKDYHIFIYENDSLDNTDTLVREFSKHPKVTGKTERGIRINKRTWSIAYARNILLKMLIKSNFNPEYVMIMDMDDVGSKNINDKINFVKKAIKCREHWDAIFPPVTYDMWAFRCKGCVINYHQLPDRYKHYYKQAIKNLKYDNNGLVQVYSTFNGIGMYKYKLYIKGYYSGKNKFFSIAAVKKRNNIYDNYKYHVSSEECEHVNFHNSLGPCRLMMCKNI